MIVNISAAMWTHAAFCTAKQAFLPGVHGAKRSFGPLGLHPRLPPPPICSAHRGPIGLLLQSTAESDFSRPHRHAQQKTTAIPRNRHGDRARSSREAPASAFCPRGCKSTSWEQMSAPPWSPNAFQL